MPIWRTLLTLAAVILTACAPKLPQTYRLTPKALVPPGVANPDLALRTVKLEIPLSSGKCTSAAPIDLKRSGSSLRAIITVADLAAKPPGWLRVWATDREAEGCIATGQAIKLAEAIVEAAPLAAPVGIRLLHRPFTPGQVSFVDLGPDNRIQVDSPILKDGADPNKPAAEDMKISQGASAAAINVDIKASPSVIGYETAWYGLDRQTTGMGVSIVPLYAESHINGAVSREAAPRVNPFHFRPGAAFFRMFFRGDRTIVIVSAPTPVELERETNALRENPAACSGFPDGSCVLMPNNMGANPHVVVTVNGTVTALPVTATVRAAILAAKAKPDDVLPKLVVRKLFAGRLAPVDFPPGSPDILNLPLAGGEEIAWQ
jgi:hypothetical protein